MSNTVKQLGFIPTNRGEYDTTGQTRYYKDNVVQYRNGSYICTPVGYSSSNLTAYTTDAPYQDGDTQLNPNWKLMASVGLVDNEPTAGSNNMVKSGGVYGEVNQLGQEVNNIGSYGYGNLYGRVFDAYLNSDGDEVTSENYYITPYIKVPEGALIFSISGMGTDNYSKIILYNANYEKLTYWSYISDPRSGYLTGSYPTAKYLRFSIKYDKAPTITIDDKTVFVGILNYKKHALASLSDTIIPNGSIKNEKLDPNGVLKSVTELGASVENLQDTCRYILNYRFIGESTTYVSNIHYGLVPGRKYRILFKNNDWDRTGVQTTGSSYLFSVSNFVNGSSTEVLVGVRVTETSVKKYYDITIPVNSDFIVLGGRAATDEVVEYSIFDVTIFNEKVDVNPGINLFNKQDNDVLIGKYVKGNGYISDSGGTYNASGYIPVNASTTYYCATDSTHGFRYVCFYDIKKAVISVSPAVADGARYFTTPAQCAFVRVTYYAASWDYAQLSLSNTRYTPYNPVGDYLSGIENNIDALKYNAAVFPDYYAEDYNRVKDTVESVMTEGSVNLSLIYDPHYGPDGQDSFPNTLQAAKNIFLLASLFSKEVPTDMFMAGGDYMKFPNQQTTTELGRRMLEYLNTWMANMDCVSAAIAGNHEEHFNGNNADAGFTFSEFYALCAKKYAVKYGFVVSDINNGLMYYDDAINKVRHIIISTYVMPPTSGTMLNAFNDILSSVPEGYSVIVYNHYGVNGTSHDIETNIKTWLDAVSASGVNFIAWISGHTHRDYIVAYNGMIVISVLSSGEKSFSEYQQDGSYQKRGFNTLGESALSIATVRKDLGKIYLTRLGRGVNMEANYNSTSGIVGRVYQSLNGNVYESDGTTPISGATVVMDFPGGSFTTTTNTSGEYTFDKLPKQAGVLKASSTGYEFNNISISISGSMTQDIIAN